jgi:predicted GNAT family N-acyltransferase
MITEKNEIDMAFAIRERVFMREQGVSREDEFDGSDGSSIQIGAFMGPRMVGCGRIRVELDRAKLERIAVDKDMRGTGIGEKIMMTMIDISRDLGLTEMVLHSQEGAVGFYSRYGFIVEGNSFIEAGIPHVRMIRTIKV